MRTTDPAPEPWKPLGERVLAPAPPPVEPKRIAPGVLQDADGRFHTDLPLPKDAP